MIPTHAELEPRDHYVYIAYRDSEPLYVGMTSNPGQRLATWGVFSGRTPNGWVTSVTHVDVWALGPGRSKAADVERATIKALDPVHNKHYSPRFEEEARLWEENEQRRLYPYRVDALRAGAA